MRLGFRRRVGGEPRAGRVVNGVQAQVVPKGTIRAVIRSHRKDMAAGHVSSSMMNEIAHREAEAKSAGPIPGLPDRWSIERARQQLADFVAGHAPRD